MDESAKTAAVVDTIESEECYGVYFLGQARPVGEDGNTLISWTTSGRIEQFDDNGESVWSVTSELGAGMGYADNRGSLY